MWQLYLLTSLEPHLGFQQRFHQNALIRYPSNLSKLHSSLKPSFKCYGSIHWYNFLLIETPIGLLSTYIKLFICAGPYLPPLLYYPKHTHTHKSKKKFFSYLQIMLAFDENLRGKISDVSSITFILILVVIVTGMHWKGTISWPLCNCVGATISLH